eukprot:10166-Heterococcus_DN1.PRE.3
MAALPSTAFNSRDHSALSHATITSYLAHTLMLIHSTYLQAFYEVTYSKVSATVVHKQLDLSYTAVGMLDDVRVQQWQSYAAFDCCTFSSCSEPMHYSCKT